MITILVRKFNAYYANRPVLTTMLTNAVLGGVADTTAQTLAALRLRARQRALEVDRKDDFFAISLGDLDSKKVPWPEEDFMTPMSKRGPPPFDFERLVRFMAYAFMMTPVQHKWFGWLQKTFPIVSPSKTGNAMRRVACDQFIFAPAGELRQDLYQDAPMAMTLTDLPRPGLACFFTFMTVAEGGGRRAVVRKFQDVYIPALKANFLVWPAVQMLNFRVIPIQFQIVSSNRPSPPIALPPFEGWHWIADFIRRRCSRLSARSGSPGRRICP